MATFLRHSQHKTKLKNTRDNTRLDLTRIFYFKSNIISTMQEVSNVTAQKLYQNHFGFIREELLVRYYLNCGDAYRLRLWFWGCLGFRFKFKKFNLLGLMTFCNDGTISRALLCLSWAGDKINQESTPNLNRSIHACAYAWESFSINK